ncbi:Esa1p-associated factor [Clarireedia jacksonii]
MKSHASHPPLPALPSHPHYLRSRAIRTENASLSSSSSSSNTDSENRWDDWVPQDRVMKFSQENRELADQLHRDMKNNQKPKSAAAGAAGGKRLAANNRANGSDFSSARGSEERHASVTAQGSGSGRGPRRNRDYDLEQEESFHARPSIKIVIPDHIKAILVDDWENITKNNQLVPLPAERSVNQMLDDYLEFEKPKRAAGSAQADILEEVVAGLKEYFEKCLGRILLYRFERNQYLELRDSWLRGEDDKKNAGDVYGAEHLCRLLVTLPELIAQTNMDLQSVNRLREELTKLTQWIGRNAAVYFVPEYETPGQEYLDKARTV